jgi:sulfatase maturation enzyme AslB (radical SAM superfamily)
MQDTQPHKPVVIREEVVEQAAEFVAAHCANRNMPFTLVLHGGGEPSIEWGLLKRLVSLTHRVADKFGVDWWSYIATNGLLSESKARWMARNFNLIGLSCDGPPDIQNRQRPTLQNKGTAKIVERTARIFNDCPIPFTVRSTITPATVHRQAEILHYIHDRLGAKEIHFEPVYSGWNTSLSGFSVADAGDFVAGFLDAQNMAVNLCCDLSISGARPNEIHGPFCNILRDVIQLTPDGSASSCFLCTDGNKSENATLSISSVNVSNTKFLIDFSRIAELRRRVLRIPIQCLDCINIYHCARECPKHCLVHEGDITIQSTGFRCSVYKNLTERWIISHANPSNVTL